MGLSLFFVLKTNPYIFHCVMPISLVKQDLVMFGQPPTHISWTLTLTARTMTPEIEHFVTISSQAGRRWSLNPWSSYLIDLDVSQLCFYAKFIYNAGCSFESTCRGICIYIPAAFKKGQTLVWKVRVPSNALTPCVALYGPTSEVVDPVSCWYAAVGHVPINKLLWNCHFMDCFVMAALYHCPVTTLKYC